MSKLTLDEAIKHCLEVTEQNDTQADKIGRQFIGSAMDKRATDCRECAADHRQLAEWLMELKDLRAEQNDQYVFIHELMSELKEAKRLLKAAVEDMCWLNENTQDSYGSCTIRTEHGCSGCPLDINSDLFCKWKHEAEALALIGEDTNVGHKSGGWISCKDNMPDTLERGLSTMYSDCCLVCDAFGWVGMAYYITDGQKSWWEFADAQNKNKIDWTEVTHWQSLPEPPKE